MSECDKHETYRRQGSPCPYCKIMELERQLSKAIKWIQHDCPLDEDMIRYCLKNGKVEVSDGR